MGIKTTAIFLTDEEIDILDAAFEVLVEGGGTYYMLRLPELVKAHRGLYGKFHAARQQEV